MDLPVASPRHVVVGGGTSAILLAHQLLQAGHCVTIVEQATPSQRTVRTNRSLWERVFKVSSIDQIWTFQSRNNQFVELEETLPQCSAGSRIIAYSAATKRGLGGNSNVNAMIHDLGCDSVFENHWPQSWSARKVRCYEEIVDAIVPQTLISTSGNMKRLMRSASKDDVENHQIYTSYNTTIDAATFCSRWRLDNLLSKKGWLENGQLRVEYGYRAEQINIVDNVANAVLIRSLDGITKVVCCENGGEVVLCCGAFETPRLLHRSGLTLSGLGKTLQDHVVVPYLMFGNWYYQWKDQQENSREFSKSSSFPINGVHGWVFLDEHGAVLPRDSSSIPSCQLLFVDGTIAPGMCELLLPDVRGYFLYSSIFRPLLLFALNIVAKTSIFRWFCGHVQGILICLVQPHSQGLMNMDAKTIDPKIISDVRDMDTLIKGVMTAREIVKKGSTQSNMWNLEVFPGFLFNFCKKWTDVKRFLQYFSTTYFHPCGTCRMGEDTSAVVDEHLRVHGISKLRICDASIIPHMPNVPIAKLCMVIGVAAAEKILEAYSQ